MMQSIITWLNHVTLQLVQKTIVAVNGSKEVLVTNLSFYAHHGVKWFFKAEIRLHLLFNLSFELLTPVTNAII